MNIQEYLFLNQDKEYAVFQANLIPSIDRKSIIGVRTPVLRQLAKDILKSKEEIEFINILPHDYFEEYQLHSFIISLFKDFQSCILEVEKFLPYIDNWATCDQLSPTIFKKHKSELLAHIKIWLNSDKTYTIRFAIGMLMRHFLDEDFDTKYNDMVANLRSDEYYINMMIAWYFATALAKQFDLTIPYIENKRLDVWTHNKTIQKAIESYRITNNQKNYLRTLKIK
jgi:3-methyladenine DNA glycosylase AlkD